MTKLIHGTASGIEDAAIHFGHHGWATIDLSLDSTVTTDLKRSLESAIEREDAWHGSADRKDAAMVLVCPLYDRQFAEVLAEPVLFDLISRLLGERSIVYAYTSSSMPPAGGNMSNRVHNDCERDTGEFLSNIGVTFALDDFTEDNGATWFLPNSRHRRDRPSPEEFFASASRALLRAGSAFVFDARLWHAGGVNATGNWRHALTVNFCHPWMKQRLDLPRLLGEGYRNSVSERAAQRLGYEAQTPASYYEYYQPEHRRPYRVN
jgi:ectoine hydroxylase-related dioxygenase (phytanoyl-CoA dioxygenase family)